MWNNEDKAITERLSVRQRERDRGNERGGVYLCLGLGFGGGCSALLLQRVSVCTENSLVGPFSFIHPSVSSSHDKMYFLFCHFY